jgi:hypothetical protein
MAAAELAEHHAGDYGRDYRFSDDGYGDIEHERKTGKWLVVAGWGADGWDLGDWPYVSFLIRKQGERYGLLQIVEGDRSEWTFDTQNDLRAAIDYLFLWYSAGEDWSPISYEQREALDAGEIRVDERFRGPYRSAEVVPS